MSRLAAVCFALLLANPAFGADPTKPHPHTGVIAAIKGAPAKPALTADDLATLAQGGSVTKQVKDADGGGRGIAVQDIKSESAVVWSKILDYPNYPVMVEGVKHCSVYDRSGDSTKVKFIITAMMMNVEYYIDHVYKPDAGYMTWTLDYSRESDLDDSVGFWLVEPLADKPGYTRVYYSVAVKLSGWVPGMVENMIAKSGLTQATGWVKRESEKVAPAN